jgi:hypothetical protein
MSDIIHDRILIDGEFEGPTIVCAGRRPAELGRASAAAPRPSHERHALANVDWLPTIDQLGAQRGRRIGAP